MQLDSFQPFSLFHSFLEIQFHVKLVILNNTYNWALQRFIHQCYYWIQQFYRSYTICSPPLSDGNHHHPLYYYWMSLNFGLFNQLTRIAELYNWALQGFIHQYSYWIPESHRSYTHCSPPSSSGSAHYPIYYYWMSLNFAHFSKNSLWD